ncbi:two-component system sensor histidine kinase TctE [Bradyrhizobium sp. JR1.5]|uniref:sensor histidine kinase n=1 Tax=unclassified Bradyrhizobium TaxID=2631580 RepID=UPI0033917556
MIATWRPSLRRTLLTNLVAPAIVLAMVLGIGGMLLIQRVVQTVHDRLLDGSILAIAERVGVEDGELTVDLPQVALGMLESQSHDSIYYSVTYLGELITGYKDLPLAGFDRLKAGETGHRDGAYRGKTVRIGAQARQVYGRPGLVLVAVAETVQARRVVEREMLIGLAMLEAGLISLIGCLGWYAVDRGLRPLGELKQEIDARGIQGGPNLSPLDLSRVPQEALAPALAVNSLLQRLDLAIGLVRRFTADASHQMRTPLAILRTHLDLVRRLGSETPAGQSALDEVDNAINRLERLLEQLVTLARVDEQNIAQPAAENVDLNEVAFNVLSERAPQAFARDIDVQFDRFDGPAVIAGNTVLIGELLANLIDNAIRYNRPGGLVLVRAVVDATTARIEVEDTGPGIPEAHLARVFERFYRIPTANGPEGSGLGLAIVKALSDRLGAQIVLAPGPEGRGLRVSVSFPLAKRDGESSS